MSFCYKNENKKLSLVNTIEKQKFIEKINDIQLVKDAEKKTEFIKIPKDIYITLKKYSDIKEKKIHYLYLLKNNLNIIHQIELIYLVENYVIYIS